MPRQAWVAFYPNWWDNWSMKDHDAKRHPGPFRVMNVDSESAGILIAVAFLVLGLVGLPIAKWFFLGALVLGSSIALLLRFIRRD